MYGFVFYGYGSVWLVSPNFWVSSFDVVAAIGLVEKFLRAVLALVCFLLCVCDLVYFAGGVVGEDFVAQCAFDGVYHVFASNVFAVGPFVEEFVAKFAGSSILSVYLYDLWQQWVEGSASFVSLFDGQVSQDVALVFAGSFFAADETGGPLRIVAVCAEHAFVDAFHVVGVSAMALLAGEFVAAVDGRETFYLVAVPAEYLNDGVGPVGPVGPVGNVAVVGRVAGEVCLQGLLGDVVEFEECLVLVEMWTVVEYIVGVEDARAHERVCFKVHVNA